MSDSVSGIIDVSKVTVSDKQAELGTEVNDLFKYVRDNIRYETYQGVLRGAQGTLISQAGNSVDQAILLYELMKAAGYRTSFIHGNLDEPQSKKLFKNIFDVKASQNTNVQADPEVREFFENVVEETKNLYQLIKGTLNQSSFEIPTISGIKNKLLREIRDHYWIQYEDNGQWIDLDPTFSEAQIGQTFAQFEEKLTTLPESLFHKVVIKIVLEEKKNGHLQEKTLLTYKSDAAELSGKSIILSHQKDSWGGPDDISALAGTIANAFTSIIEGTSTKAKPILFLRNRYEVGSSFKIPDESGSSTTGNSTVGFGFGGLADLFESSGIQNETEITAEWIDFEFQYPNGQTEDTRRFIFDRIGFFNRQKNSTEISDSSFKKQKFLTNTFCLSFYTGFLASKKIFSDQMDDNLPDQFFDLGMTLETINHSVNFFSDRLTFPLKIGSEQVIFSYSSPRLIISSLHEENDTAILSIDLHHSQYQDVTKSEELSKKSFLLKILKGALDEVVEGNCLNLLRSLNDSTVNKFEFGSYSTNLIFTKASENSLPIRLLKNSSDTNADFLQSIVDEPRARIKSDVFKGNLVITPEKMINFDGNQRIGWWRIDKVSGKTTGVAENGQHAFAEYVKIVKDPLTNQIVVTYFRGGILQGATFATERLALSFLRVAVRHGITTIVLTRPFF